MTPENFLFENSQERHVYNTLLQAYEKHGATLYEELRTATTQENDLLEANQLSKERFEDILESSYNEYLKTYRHFF
jgi:hypothetical protein